jgi:hypothetical protein
MELDSAKRKVVCLNRISKMISMTHNLILINLNSIYLCKEQMRGDGWMEEESGCGNDPEDAEEGRVERM